MVSILDLKVIRLVLFDGYQCACLATQVLSGKAICLGNSNVISDVLIQVKQTRRE